MADELQEDEADQFYLVTMYELYAQRVRIKAGSLAESIIGVGNGDGEKVGDPEYLEVASDYGISGEDELDMDTVRELREDRSSPWDRKSGILCGIRSAGLDPDQQEYGGEHYCQDCGRVEPEIEFVPTDGNPAKHVCPSCGSTNIFTT